MMRSLSQVTIITIVHCCIVHHVMNLYSSSLAENDYGNKKARQATATTRLLSSPRMICESDQSPVSSSCSRDIPDAKTTTTTTTSTTTTPATTTTTKTTRTTPTSKTTERKTTPTIAHQTVIVTLPSSKKPTTTTQQPTTSSEPVTQEHLIRKLGATKLASSTSTEPTISTTLVNKPTEKVKTNNNQNLHHNSGTMVNFPANNVLVAKDNLVKRVLSTGQMFCSFDEELHSQNTNPVCKKPEWKIGDNEASLSVEYNGRSPRGKRSLVVGQREPLTLEERRKLQRLYGNQFNLEAAERVKAMGAEEREDWGPGHHHHHQQPSPSRWNNRRNYNYDNRRHRRQPRRWLQSHNGRQNDDENQNRRWVPSTNSRQNEELQIAPAQVAEVDERHFQMEDRVNTRQRNYGVSSSYSDRETENANMDETFGRRTKRKDIESELEEERDAEEECSLFGTWLSPLAGVAIILRPIGKTIGVTLENLPGVKNRLMSSSWVGTVQISPVSPTTVTLIFQEGPLTPKESLDESPETAVFVGQCIYCKGGTAIQGSWVIFTRKRNCLPAAVISNVTATALGHSSPENLYRPSVY